MRHLSQNTLYKTKIIENKHFLHFLLIKNCKLNKYLQKITKIYKIMNFFHKLELKQELLCLLQIELKKNLKFL